MDALIPALILALILVIILVVSRSASKRSTSLPANGEGPLGKVSSGEYNRVRKALKTLGGLSQPGGGAVTFRSGDMASASEEYHRIIETPGSVRVLVLALKDSDSAVRREAAEALGKMRDFKAVDALKEALNDPDQSVREEAAKTLELMGAQ